MKRITKLFTALALALGLTTAASAAKQDENGITPYTWYEFDSLDIGAISASTTIPNSGSCTAGWSVTDGTVIANDGTGKAWTIGSTAYSPSTAKSGASVNPSTYVVRVNFNGQTFSGDKVVWSCNGRAYNGLCLTVRGNATDGYTVDLCKHGGSKSTVAYSYAVPAEKKEGYHWYAVTTSGQPMFGTSVLYVDGLAVATSGGSGNWYSGQNEYFSFGKYGNGNAAVATGISYDDIRMYGQVLTARQVAKIAGIKLGDDYATWIDEDGGALSTAEWNPEHTGAFTAADTITITSTVAKATFALDQDLTVGKLSGVSEAGNMLVIKRPSDLTMNVGAIDFSGAVDGIGWDATEGYTACTVLKDYYRNNNQKITFFGEGENGATITYERAGTKTFPSHLVFEGGKHSFTYGQNTERDFGANATEENPTILVKSGTILDFYGHDLCGWSGTANLNGIIKVENGGRIYMKQEGGNGTVYYRQRISINPGGQFYVDMTENDFRLQGGTAEATAQIYVPASEGGVAYIKPVEVTRDSIYLATDNTKGVAVKVEAGSTLDIQTKLASANNQACEVKKYGAGALKLSGGVSGFQGKLTVAAGTLEYATATALPAAATITVDAGATLKIAADEDRAFAKTVSGSGAVVKAGEGTLTVAAGAFGDNVVSIEDGKIKFTATSAQAKEGVVLCKAATDISENVIVVNEAGKELSGDFTFEDNTLSFKVNCVDLYLVIDAYSPASWSQLIEGKGWINSPESTITITNNTIVTFDFDEAITAKSLKIVSASSDDQLGISYEDFANLTIGSYDFTEAEATYGGVEIECVDAPANTETRIITGATITGFENVVPLDDDIPAGTGFYADATHIWLCKEVDITRMNPVTGDEVTFTYAFFGSTDGDWEKCANWRQCENDLFTPYTNSVVAPALRNGSLQPVLFDGEQMDDIEPEEDYKCVTADGDPTVDGWNGQYGFYNGVKVTAGELYGITSGGVQLNWYVDDTSKFIIAKGPSTNYGSKRTLNFWVAAEDGVEFVQKYTVDATFNYAMAGYGSVKFDGGIAGATHNLTNGTLKVEGDGFTGGTLNVLGVAALVTPALTATVNIAEGATLTLRSSAEGDLTIGGNWTNNGTLEVVAGTVVFKPGVTPGSYTIYGGKVIIGQTVTINDCGKIAVTGATVDDVRLFDVGGNPVTVTKVEGGYAYYDWDVTGKNCWWDYEFNGNLDSVGTDTQTLSEEGTKPYYNEENTALRVGYGTPYRGATYPEEFTAVIYGKMVNNATHIEIGFGSTYAGTAKGVVIACGDPSKDEVKLLVTSDYGVVETIPMTVTDPYDTDHLYAFTCQTINDGGTDKTKVSLYLDGKFLQSYTFGSKVTLGTGFQVGSIHGGSLAGYAKATTANTHADLDFLRTYKTVLSAEAMKMYAEKYPYTSKGGASVRTFDDSLDQTWVAYGITPWTVSPFEEESFPTNSALAGSQVTVSASADAEVTMNLDATTTYESLTIGEGSAIAFKAGEDAVEPTITGGTTIKTDVMVDYNAIKFGTVEVASDKTLTFDFTDFPFDTYYQSETIPFTGATSGEGTITSTELPTEGIRTATFEKNASTDQYELKITIAEGTPFIYTIAAGEETGVWTFGEGGEEVTEEIVDANPGTPIQKEGDGTLQKDLANRTYVVNEGLFTTTNAANKYATITVNGTGSTFDYNGSADGYITMYLNGGTLLNTGDAIGTGSRQMQGLTLTANSTVGGTGDFGLIASGYAENVLDLGGYSLTKDGSNAFYLNNTTVSNGTLYVTNGSIRVTGKPVVFADDAKLVLKSGTTLTVENPLTIGAIEADKATINNTSSITPFVLSGEATLTGNGTWGTNTLDGATVNVGTKHDFVFAGAGWVNAVLTAAEIAQEGPITIFEVEEGLTSITGNKVYDEAGNEVPGNWAGGSFQVDHEAKIGDVYYLTFNAALDAATAGQTVTLLKDIETATPAAFVIDKSITLDFGTSTITKTVANDWVFQIAKDAEVTFAGTTGGVVHYPAVLNPDYPASMIQILGKLTVEGGVYESDYTVFKVDEDDAATHTAKGELVVNGGTFTIEPQTGTTYKGLTYAVMNWSKATLNGGTFTGDITTLSYDGNTVSKAGETIVGDDVAGTPVYKLQVTGSTYENVPKIKGVAKSNVTLVQSPSITDTLFLIEKDGYVTVAGNPEAKIGTTYYLTFAEALEAAKDDDTVTLLKDITTAETAAFTIAKNITVDFDDYTITKTVANDWVFQIAKGADVIFKGGKGGIVHYPAVLNPVNPASMIQILGKLTVAGGAYKSDYTIFKVDEDDAATHEAKGELVVNAGTFTIEPQPETTYTGLTYAVMNWSKATLGGGTFTGTIATLSNDGNACSKAGETIVNGTIAGMPVYTLQVTGSTYENVPKIKGVEIDNVKLVKSASITDELMLVEDGEYVTVQKKPEIEPVTPGEPIPAETPEQAVDIANDINTNAVLKAAMLKAPEGSGLEGEGLAAYQLCFTAVANGTAVTFELNELGTNAVVIATDAANTNALDVALSIESSTLTIDEPLVGFYYSLKQGGDVKDLGFNDPGDQDKLATSAGVSFDLVKPEGAGFYQTIITPAPTK